MDPQIRKMFDASRPSLAVERTGFDMDMNRLDEVGRVTMLSQPHLVNQGNYECASAVGLSPLLGKAEMGDRRNSTPPSAQIIKPYISFFTR